jgi:hypothetical protein
VLPFTGYEEDHGGYEEDHGSDEDSSDQEPAKKRSGATSSGATLTVNANDPRSGATSTRSLHKKENVEGEEEKNYQVVVEEEIIADV